VQWRNGNGGRGPARHDFDSVTCIANSSLSNHSGQQLVMTIWPLKLALAKKFNYPFLISTMACLV